MENNLKIFKDEFNQIGKLWRRAIAYIADGFILLLPTLIIVFGYIFIASGCNFQHILQKPKPEDIKTAVTLQVILSFVYLSYFTYFIGKSGQSPGKKAMGLKVVDSEGAVVGYTKAFIRYLIFILYSLGTIGGLIFLISLIIAIVDKQRRTLHDRVCKTFVVGTKIEPDIEKIRQEGKQRISGPAIFALLLSIFCIFVPIIGQFICFYVCGRVLYDIKESNGLLKGKSLAIAGIIISVALLILFSSITFMFIRQDLKR